MKEKQEALVSIITPSYNSETYIISTIQSVLNQTYKNWEMIIVDDCSTDLSPELIKDIKDDRIIYIKRKQNLGVAEARNLGIKQAQGKYIAFLDSDDTWDKNKLSLQIDSMEQNRYDFSYTAYRKIDSLSNVIAQKVPVTEEGITYEKLLKHNEIGCLTAVYNAEQLGKYYFLKIGHEDFVCWLSILKSGVKAYGINQVLASYRVHNNSISSNKFKAMSFTWHIYRNVEKLSFLDSVKNFLFYSVNSFMKYIKK